MEEHYTRSCQIPAFGSWDCYDGLPFTQCFETVHQTADGFIHYTYPNHGDEDLYVAGDLYANDVVTPAMIVVPRRRKAKVNHEKGTDVKGNKWEVGNLKETRPPRRNPKPVDEDLYKISPDLLYAKTNKKRGLSFFSCWVLPSCGL